MEQVSESTRREADLIRQDRAGETALRADRQPIRSDVRPGLLEPCRELLRA